MPQEFEHQTDVSPQFHDAPGEDQPGTPSPAGAPEATGLTRDEPQAAYTPDPPKPTPPSASQPKPDSMQGEAKQPSRPAIISGAVMMVVGAAIGVGTFFLGRAYAPPRPPGEVEGKPPADMVKQDDFKKLSDHVDKMTMDVDQSKKQIADRPDYSNQMKMFNDRINELQQAVTQMGPQFNSISQKMDTMSKVEDAGSSGRVDALSKRVDDLSHSLDALRTSSRPGPRAAGEPAGSSRVEDVNVQGLAMDQAVELFNAKKYTEAKDAFIKLQAIFPNDARVWYYSALANGFATRKWLGETEQMVNTGLEKEKAGQPSSDKVDAIFANLDPSPKAWLDAYRKRIGR